MEFTVPENQRATLRALIHLEASLKSQLLQALESAQPTVSSEAFLEAVAHRAGIPQTETRDIVRILFTLYSLRTDFNWPLHYFAEEIADAAQEARLADLEPGSEIRTAFVDFLERALSFHKSIGVTAKAASLLIHDSNPVVGSRIVSEIRPIFVESESAGPSNVVAAMIIHSLRIRVLRSNESEDFYFSLDEDDLRELRDVIDRAAGKAERLRDIIASSHIQYIERGGEEFSS